MADEQVRVSIEGLSDLSLEDLEALEKAAAMRFGKIMSVFQTDEEGNLISTDGITARLLKAVAWILARQDNPTLTLKDVGQVKLDALAGLTGGTTKDGGSPPVGPPDGGGSSSL